MGEAADLEFVSLQESLVGRYSLEAEIGRGGMGIVYLAHDVRLDRPVALKLLPPAYAAQPLLRERFLREARTAAKLSHPNIVPIHSVEEVDDFVFFLMAYVDGQTLGERIRQRGPVPPSDAARVLREVSWALAYAHAQGVVHRDVKPDNILLEAGNGRALVTDFGIAQVSEVGGPTSEREVLGTAEFMSPEQAAGDPVDERSDIYSLGVVGYYMLSRQLPFEGETVAATLAKQITQPAPALASVAPEVPRHLAQAIDRCLEKDPVDRFSGGEELAEGLGRSVEARRETPVALRVFIEQSRERFRGGVGLILLVVYLVSLSGYAFLAEGEAVAAALTGLLAAMMGGAPVVMLGRMARRLLRSGYGHADLLRALRSDVEKRKEEMAFELADGTTWLDRAAPALVYGGLGAMVVGTVGLVLLDEGVVSVPISMLVASLGVGGLVSLVATPIAMTRFKRSRKLPGTWWLKFWNSRPGKWLFRIAGVRLRRVPGAGATYRPTEMAIGLAADRLYEELPKDLRESFRDVPAVVRRLETDAERMRARVDELDEMLDDLDTPERGSSAAAPGVDDGRDSLADDLRAARDAAQDRMTQLVSALETIRLGLLRLHAGAGSVERMTADLGAARDLSDEIAHALEGRRRVDELLGSIEAPQELETPLPS